MKNILTSKTKMLAAAALVIAAGCNDFLDQPTPGKMSLTEFYKTEQDAQQATIAIYDRIGADYYVNWASMYMMKTMLSDEGTCGGSNNTDQVGYQNLDDYTTDSQNDKVRDVWRQYYSAIQRACAVVNNTLPDTDIKKQSIAEAKALRAFAYFELVHMWGDVPIVPGYVDPAKYVGYPRSPKADVYALIEKDLNDAIVDLPLKSKYSAADKFRVSKGTAQALLGKVLMFESASTANGGLGVDKWAAAASLFDAVIHSGEYALESSVQKVFGIGGEFGKESLFELSFVSLNYTWGNAPWSTTYESNIHIQLMGPRNYTAAPGDSLIGGWGFNLPSAKMYNAFETGDKRKAITIMSQAELVAAGGTFDATQWDYNGFIRRKYGTFTSQTTGANGVTPDLNYGTNFRLIRYSDVLLMAAEANHFSGNDAVAVGYLNQVRNRSGLPNTTYTSGSDLFMKGIVPERFVELAFEGTRFEDLVRWGLASAELPAPYDPMKHNLLPIPNSDVLSSSLPQNPGY